MFDVCEMLRKVVLAVTMELLTKGKASQLLLAILCCAARTLVIAWNQPHAAAWLSMVAFLASASLTLTVLAGLRHTRSCSSRAGAELGHSPLVAFHKVVVHQGRWWHALSLVERTRGGRRSSMSGITQSFWWFSRVLGWQRGAPLLIAAGETMQQPIHTHTLQAWR